MEIQLVLSIVKATINFQSKSCCPDRMGGAVKRW